jgi:transcriptional regulator with XRE-family HTH domain
VHPSRDLLLIQSFAAAVKARRHALGFSQEELAHRADIGRTYIGKLELAQNQPSLSVLYRLCAALDVSPEELLADTAKRLRKSKQLV